MVGDILAVDLGGTYIKYGVVNDKFEIIETFKIPTPGFESTDFLYDRVCAAMPDLGSVDLIGVSCPGLVDNEGNVKTNVFPNPAVLFGTNVKTEIERRTGKRTAALNDARAAGLCELKLGNARGTKLSAFLIIGTGAGGCICDEDGILSGADNFAGEFHFMAYWNERTREVMKCGRVSGMYGLLKMYNEEAPENHRASFGKEITDRYLAGEPLAARIVDEWILKISLHCLSIVVAINPEVLCVGGGITEQDWFFEKLKATYHERCLEHFINADFLTTRIERCKFRNDANLLGAALKAAMEYR